MVLLLVSRTSSRPPLKICSSGPWPGLEEFPFSSPWRLETVRFWFSPGLVFSLRKTGLVFSLRKTSQCRCFKGGYSPFSSVTFWGDKPPFFLLNIMMHSSPSCSRKKSWVIWSYITNGGAFIPVMLSGICRALVVFWLIYVAEFSTKICHTDR